MKKLDIMTVKKVAKYATNIMAITNALIIGLAPIWNIPYADKITETLSVLMAVTATYLLGDKALSYNTKVIEEVE